MEFRIENNLPLLAINSYTKRFLIQMKLLFQNVADIKQFSFLRQDMEIYFEGDKPVFKIQDAIKILLNGQINIILI